MRWKHAVFVCLALSLLSAKHLPPDVRAALEKSRGLGDQITIDLRSTHPDSAKVLERFNIANIPATINGHAGYLAATPRLDSHRPGDILIRKCRSQCCSPTRRELIYDWNLILRREKFSPSAPTAKEPVKSTGR